MVRRKKIKPTAHNRKIQEDTRNRIKAAVNKFIEQNDWPEGITQRYDQLCTIKVSGETLYKHKDLWHPKHQNSKAVHEKIDSEKINR